MGDKVLEIVAIGLGVLLVVGVLTFAGPCIHEDGSAATCQPSQFAVLGAGIVAVLAALGALLMRNGKVAGALLLIAAAAGVFSAFAPGNAFPLCMMATMRCHVVMQPFAQFMGIALAAVALIAGIRAFRMQGSSS